MIVIKAELQSAPYVKGQNPSLASQHPTYCTVCLNLSSSTAFSLFGARPDITSDETIRFDRTAWTATARIYDLLESSKEGCQTCELLFEGHNGVLQGEIDLEIPDLAISFTFCPDTVVRIGLGRLSEVSDDSEDEFLGFGASEAQSISWDHWYFNYEMFVLPGCTSPWPVIGNDMTKYDPNTNAVPWKGGSARNIPLDPHQDATYDLIGKWMKDCSSTHAACETIKETALPTRVVDIGAASDNSQIRLHSSEHTRAQYIALSHCWGLVPIITTKKATLENWRRSIPFDDLSRTFQDAVNVTRRLGFRHIWIDSLCIIQDSTEDWEREAAKMADIYQNSSIVLAASGSSDGSGGCLINRSSTAEMKGTNIKGEPFSIFARRTCSHSIFNWGISRGSSSISSNEYAASYTLSNPLFGRAWCYQERLLAPRMIHFTAKELVWECLTYMHCECGAMDNFTGDPLLVAKQSAIRTPNESGQDVSRLIDLEDHLRTWQSLAGQYSQKHITYASDILPAVSALASRFATPETGPYLAGIWRASLPQGLLWHSLAGMPRSSDNREIRVVKPDEYLAPSWSWASLLAPVDWLGSLKYTQWYVDVLDAQCTHSGANQYGGVSSGWLRLSGPLIEVTLTRRDPGDGNASWIKYKDLEKAFHFYQDDPVRAQKAIENGEKVYCLKMCRDTMNLETVGGGRGKAWVLVRVQQIFDRRNLGIRADDNVFRRLGVMGECPDEWDWILNSDKTEVVVI